MFRIVQQARPSAQEFLAGIESLDWTAQITANNIKKKETCWITTIRMCCILTCMKQDYSSTHPPDWTHMVIINAQKKGLFFLCFLHKGICARHHSSAPRNHICCWEIEISRLKLSSLNYHSANFLNNSYTTTFGQKKRIKLIPIWVPRCSAIKPLSSFFVVLI